MNLPIYFGCMCQPSKHSMRGRTSTGKFSTKSRSFSNEIVTCNHKVKVFEGFGREITNKLWLYSANRCAGVFCSELFHRGVLSEGKNHIPMCVLVFIVEHGLMSQLCQSIAIVMKPHSIRSIAHFIFILVLKDNFQWGH